jgi:uncharacterized membrane protein YidH (DUF202 family)
MGETRAETDAETSSNAGATGPEAAERDEAPASERTALAWTRSALTMAASGVLIARAAFVGHLPVLGVVSAGAMAILSALT